jgi:hypothetical protein
LDRRKVIRNKKEKKNPNKPRQDTKELHKKEQTLPSPEPGLPRRPMTKAQRLKKFGRI